jgi:hypothetical protein
MREYMHIERFGNDAVLGIELGETYVFPKLDGTNASLWWDLVGPEQGYSYSEGEPYRGLLAGSRHRELSLGNDNAGFYHACVADQTRYNKYFNTHPKHILYGEWLVPHTLKTYRDNAWRRFWIFDVFNTESDGYLDYETYAPLLTACDLDFVPPLARIKNGSYENFVHVLDQNNFFIKDGQGLGEGIVIKNYSYYNKFDQQVWAKIIRSEFKEQHYKEMGSPESVQLMVEEQIALEYCTTALCEKELAKIKLEKQGWTSQYIPQLLGVIFHSLITEEIWDILKKYKNPTINFNTLKHFVIKQIKLNLPEYF